MIVLVLGMLLLLLLSLLPFIATVIINGAISSASGGSSGGGGTPGPSVTISTSLTWTATAISDNNAPATDTATDCRAMTQLLVDCDMSGVTGSSTADFKLIVSLTSASAGFGDSANPYVEVVTALAAAARVVRAVTVPGGWARGRLDVNTANIPAGQTVTMRIYTLK